MIQIQELRKNFGDLEVLKGINTQWEMGKTYGIVGVNGAGKTTLFQCLLGLETFQGKVDFGSSKPKLGYLPAEPFFFSYMKAKEYVQFCLSAKNIEIPDLEKHNIFDLPLHRFASDFSTGMKKKLAFWTVLLQKNDVLVLDEPFNGVDLQSHLMMTELLHQLKAKGKLLLLSSHIFSTLADTCDAIQLLENGHLSKAVLPSEFDQFQEKLKQYSVQHQLEDLSWI